MGLATYLGFKAPPPAPLTSATPTPSTPRRATAARARPRFASGIRSPWSAPSGLADVVWQDWFTADGDVVPINRQTALTIPAVVRGVQQVTAPLMACPWVQYEGDTASVNQPTWLYATDSEVAPQYRTGFVAEDLVLHGWSVLLIGKDGRGAINAVDRLSPALWAFDGDGNVTDADGQPLEAGTYALIKGPHDGILTTGARTLRGAIALETAWTKAVRNPQPTTILQQTTDDTLEDEEVDSLLEDWRVARQDPEGTVAFIPYGIEASFPGETVTELLVQARNAAAVDIARLIGIPAAAVDAGAVQTSLTYTNTSVGVGLQLAQQGVKPYADAIGAGLSLDTVTPKGTRIALDMTQLFADAATISPSGTPTKD
jgi:hypothetical protein